MVSSKETYIGELGEKRVGYDSHDTIDDGAGSQKRMTIEMTSRIWFVDILGIHVQVHEKVHDQEAIIVSGVRNARVKCLPSNGDTELSRRP